MKIDVKRLIEDKKYCREVFNHYLRIGILEKTNTLFFEKHVDKSISNLEFANFLLEEHNRSIKEKFPKRTFYDWCVTAYYYSIYHMATALITKIGYSSKSHIATITAITLLYYHQENILRKEDVEFIIEKIHLNKEDIDLVLSSKGLRERACYGVDASFELSKVKTIQKQTAGFVTKIKDLLNQ